MTAFTDAERREWLEMRRKNVSIDDDDRGTTDAACSHCGNQFASQSGMVSDDFALCAACDGD